MNHVRGTPALGLWCATLGFFAGFAAVATFVPTMRQFQEVMRLSLRLVTTPALTGSLLGTSRVEPEIESLPEMINTA